jgi:sugar (pentulose or hexulose) kinase
VSRLALGLDLGSSGLRLALVEEASGQLLHEEASTYPAPFEDPEGWRCGAISLISRLPAQQRQRIAALAVDGTSGTLLLCRSDGTLLPGDLARALPYHRACPRQALAAAALAEHSRSPAARASGSLARALELLQRARVLPADPGASPLATLIVRHQADWLMGWLLGDWRWGEEGNNLRLGWDLDHGRWDGAIGRQPWAAALPRICPSGQVLGPLSAGAAHRLGLPATALVVAGSTDANAGVLAAEPQEGDGITVLGTTLVLKQFVAQPIQGPGVSCHRVDGRWLVGGASNAGAGILCRFFSDDQITALSRQLDPERPSGLDLLPLPARGERFPIDDPELEPRLGPRPVSDALYLQALLEGLTAIELAGWRQLRALGTPALRRVISLGGGARNPQWRRLRQRALGVPVLNRPGLSAALGMARLAARSRARMDTSPSPAG